MGEMLAETERAKGGQPYQSKPTGRTVLPVEPTLADLGISKRESSDGVQSTGRLSFIFRQLRILLVRAV
jgi:hypothetical protein